MMTMTVTKTCERSKTEAATSDRQARLLEDTLASIKRFKEATADKVVHLDAAGRREVIQALDYATLGLIGSMAIGRRSSAATRV
jgi:hypothetical protein